MMVNFPKCPFTGSLSGTKGQDDSLDLKYRGTETCAGKKVFRGAYKLAVRLYEGQAAR